MDHTPLFGWMIESLRYLRRLAEVVRPETGLALIDGLTSFNGLLEKYLREHAPVTKHQAGRLTELACNLKDALDGKEISNPEWVDLQLRRLVESAITATEQAQ